MATVFFFDAHRPAAAAEAPATQEATGRRRLRGVETVLTIAVAAWFTAALALMIGELAGLPGVPAAAPATAGDEARALPALARPAIDPAAKWRLI